jgi:branched-chain amino acid transport system permease protein
MKSSRHPLSWTPARRGIALFFFLLILPLIASSLGQPFYVKFATRIVIFSIAAVSLSLILSWGGMVSLGHAAFMGISAYVVAICSWHLTNAESIQFGAIVFHGSTSAYVVWPLAIAAAGLVGLLVGLVSLRTSGLYFIMITLAFGQMFYYSAIALQKYGGDDGMSIARSNLPWISLSNPYHLYYFSLLVLAASQLLVQRIVHSSAGAVVRGARQNEQRVESIGYPVFWFKLIFFVIASMLCGMSGILFANSEAYVSPSMLHWTRSAELIIIIVIGGIRFPLGPIVGAFAFLVLEFLLGSATTYWQALLGFLLIAVVLSGSRTLFGKKNVRRAP